MADASLDLSKGPVEESCKIDMEPTLEAGLPSVEIEGLQGDAPDLGEVGAYAEKPGFDVSGPQVDNPEVKLKTQVSGPNAYSNIDFNDPSSDLNLPSSKTKRGKCFSCVSSGDKDEPYSKGKANAGLDLDRPNVDRSIDMKTDGKIATGSGLDGKGLGLHPMVPNVSVPSTSASGNLSGPSVEMNPKVQLHSDSPSIKTPEGNLRTRMSGPDVDVSAIQVEGPERKAGIPSSELDLPIKKKKRGNCFSCAGGTDKEEAYTKRKGNAAIDFNRPDVDGSMEMRAVDDFDVSGTHNKLGGDTRNLQPKELGLHASAPDVDIPKSDQQGNIEISGPNASLPSPHVSAKVPERSLGGESINAPRIDTRGEKMKPEISGLDVDVPAGKLQGRRAQFDTPSAELDVPSTKKKPSSCFSCAGDGDKDDSYRKTKGNVGYDFSGPDGSLEMKAVGEFDLNRSDPDFAKRGMNKEFELRAARPDVEVNGENRGISPETSGIAVNARGPEINDPDVSKPSGETNMSVSDTSINKDVDFNVSGPDVSLSRKHPEGLHTTTPNIDTPEANLSTQMSGPDVDVSTRNIRDPKARPDVPSADLNLSSPKKKRGNCLSCTGSADKDEPYRKKKGDAKFGLNGPEVQGSTDGSGLDIDTEKPSVGFDANAPEFNKKGKIRAETSRPDVDVPSGSSRDPKVNIISPSADLPPRSRKKPRGNCLSCKGNVDKDEPYIKAQRNAQFDFDGQDVNGSMELKKPAISKTNATFGGRAGPDFDIDTPDIDVSVQKQSSGLKSPEFDVPKARGTRAIDVDGPDFSYDKPRISEPSLGKPNESSDVSLSNRSINNPDIDTSVTTPDTGVKSLEFGVPKLGASGEIDARPNVNAPDFNPTKGKLQTEISTPNVVGPSGHFRGPDANLQGPSADLPSASKRKPRGNCLSCTGGADKDEPYRRAKGNTQFDIDGPNHDGSVEAKKSGIGEPKVDIDGRATYPGFDIDTPDIDVSTRKPKSGLKSPEFDFPKARGTREIDFDGPALSYDTPKISKPSVGKTNEGIDIPASNRGVSNPDIDASVNTPDTGFNLPEFGVPKLGTSAEIEARPNVNAPDFNSKKGKLQTEISKPDVDVPSANLGGPDANLQGPSADLPSASKRKPRGNCLSCTGGADKDEPYRKAKGNTQFNFDRPDLDGSVEMKGIGESKVDIDGGATGQTFDISNPDNHVSSKKTEIGLISSGVDAPKRGGLGEIDIAGPDLSYRQPKVSGPSLDKTEGHVDIRKPDFGINTPDIETTNKPNIGLNSSGLDVPKTKGAGQIDLNGTGFSYEKPNLSGPSIGQRGQENDTTRLDLDIDAPKSPGDFDIPKPDISVPFKDGDITLTSASREDLDVEANLPDIEVSNIKRGFGLDTNGLDIDIPGVEKNLNGVQPSVSSLHADTSAYKPTIGLDMNGLDVDHTGDVDFDLNRPYGVDMTGLDTPDSDYSFPPIGDKEQSFEPVEINDDRGKDFDVKFDWGINTSTPKAPKVTKQLIGLPRGEINLESSPVEDDISVVNTYDTLDLHSTPQPVPSAAFHEPHSLQRYDEIRPEMELRLLPPTEMNKSDQSFEFDIPDNSEDKAKNSWKPGSMKLVKVEENVTVCSASVEESESHSPRNRTLSLDRNIRQKIELVFPEEEKQKRSSSSSSSSDSDGQEEEKPKRKKKSRLLKAFRKSSSSSTSSKEGRTSLRQKEKEKEQNPSARSSSSEDEEGKGKKSPIQRDVTPSSREGHAPLKQDNRESKQATSSSSSDDEDEGRIKRLSKVDVLLVKTTEEKKARTTSTSSSSDEAPSFLHGKGLSKRKSSKSSSSSDKENHDGEKQLLLAQTTFEKKELEEPVPSITKVQEDMPTVGSRSVKPVSDLNFAVDKPDGDIKPKERKHSTSSSSDEESKSSMVYKVEYSMYQQQYAVEPEIEPDEPVLSVADMREDATEVALNLSKPADPEFVFMSDMQKKPKEQKTSSSSSSSSDAEDAPTVDLSSVKPISPDLPFLGEKQDDEIKQKERKSSSSSSSDEEPKSAVVYEVEDIMLQQHSVLEPESGHEQPVLSVADVQEGAPEDVMHSAEPNDPEFMFTLDVQTKPNWRKSSTSSSSSSDSVKPADQDLSLPVEKPDDVIKPKEWKGSMSSPSDEESRSPVVYRVEYTAYHQQYPAEPEGESDQPVPSVEEVQEDPPEVTLHSVNPTDADSNVMPDSPTNLNERKSSTSSSSSSDTDTSNDNKDSETTDVLDPKAMVDISLPQKYFVSYDIMKPDYPQQTEKQLPLERKSSTSSSSDEIDDSSHSLDLTVYKYETVHHVIPADYLPTEQETNSSEVQENSFVVVSRSFKRPSPDIWSTTKENQDEPQVLSSTDVQFSEPPTDLTYHLEYPFNHPEVDEDKSAHIQEEGIVAVFRSPSVDHDMSNVSAKLESPDEDGTVDQTSRTSPTWNIHAHTFETVYQVTIPDSPATDTNSLEIQELAPTVVTRSVKRTSPVIASEYDNLEVEPHFSTSSTEVQFSEPSNDFQLEYTKNGRVLTTDEPDVTLTDEEWIMKHTKETPDISALLAGFDHANEKALQTSDSRDKTEDEESPKDIVRRGSSSRLWDLMQGYLIEQPIMNDGGANSESEPEKSVQKEEPKLEITESVSTVESSVPVLNQQTETVHQVTQHASNIVTYKILLDDKKPSKEVTTSITKVERSVSEVTPTVSKFDPVNFQVNVDDKRPVVKEHTTSHWRKQISVPVDVDDDDEDPWMRHYSKGLQRATSYQVMSTKPPESETSFAQSRSLSLSKVPHVKGVKTSTEKERERTRYSIDSRIHTEPTGYRVTTQRRPLLRELEAVPRIRTNENVFSIKDGKTQSPKTQTDTTKEGSPRGTSGSAPSVQSLRSFWDK